MDRRGDYALEDFFCYLAGVLLVVEYHLSFFFLAESALELLGLGVGGWLVGVLSGLGGMAVKLL